MVLHLDIETYCNLDVNKVGVYRYSRHKSFEILLLAFSFDDNEEIVIDLASGEDLPVSVYNALEDPRVIKMAHNANFEFECFTQFYPDLELDIRQWRCTMVAAAYLGLPLGLDKVSQVVGLIAKKDARGKALIKYFCQPCKPTKRNGGRCRNLPQHDPEKWDDFKGYNVQDAVVEKAVDKYTARFPAMPAIEWEYWYQDQQINAEGVYIDRAFVERAIEINRKELALIHQKIIDLTGVENPNSRDQIIRWVRDNWDEPVKSLGKEFVEDFLKLDDLPAKVRRFFKLRQLAANTSVSKYEAMLRYMCDDGCIRGLLQFYGANRTGRFAGRGVQIQNMKKTLSNADDIKALAGRLEVDKDGVLRMVGDSLLTARAAVMQGVAPLLYDNVPGVISKLVRTALVAPEGYALCVSDFAAIEARVLAWLAGETWVLEVFRTHGKLYEATAANMFGVPISTVTKGSDLRKKGKIAALALGYQGAIGALIKMGAIRDGLKESELPGIVRGWRSANPNIVKLWRKVENAARHVVERRTSHTLHLPSCDIKFQYDRGYLFITLPSGRVLSYYGAKVTDGKLSYWGVDQVKKIWVRIKTYGGSLVENITQAIARDCLTEAMYYMGQDGVRILFHVHDEIVAKAKLAYAAATLDLMNDAMAVSPTWCKDLPLKGDGYISTYYKKD